MTESLYKITLPSLVDEFKALAKGARFFDFSEQFRHNECIMVTRAELEAVEIRLKERMKRQMEEISRAYVPA